MDPMFRTVDARNPSRDQAMVLEEIEVSSSEFLEIVSLTCLADLLDFFGPLNS